MKKTAFIILLLIFANGPAFSANYITWMGCGISKKAFMDKLSKVYTQKTGVTFRMAGGGATKGIRLTANGHADVGGSCRHRLVDENNAIVPEEKNVKMIMVGWDALVVITSQHNPVNNLTMDQLRAIFRGEIGNWRNVGGPDEIITLLVRKGKISGVGHMFRLLVMQDKDFEFPMRARKFRSSGPLEEVLERQKNHHYSIAVTGVSSAKKRQVKILSINGVSPTKEHVRSGDYALFRPLYLVVGKQLNEKTQHFVDFVLSPEGQQIISNEGTVNMEEGKHLLQQWHNKPAT